MIKSLREKIEEILIKSNKLSKDQLNKALGIHKDKGGSLSKILVKEGFISDKDLLVLLSEGLQIPPINLSKYKIDSDVIKLIPEKIALTYKIIPISRICDTLTIVMADPLNIFAIDEVKMLTKYNIEPVIATEADILKAIDIYYKTASMKMEKLLEEVSIEDVEVVKEEPIDAKQLMSESQTAPIVRMVDLILEEALGKRASDVHVEPREDKLIVRYRIDGNLKESLLVPKEKQNALIARLKIMSGLDITESRLPQDGRFKIDFKGRQIDFRVSALPITYGQKIVLRALDKSNLSLGLDKLGFLEDSLVKFKEAVLRPFGMILITGPTGSGKSTTLYSILNQLNSVDRNIVTIEDPVEYQIEGITQIQVKPEIGLTFVNGLRSVLRQSPDIIMVGEIRDFETADIAIKASLTGELIFSTLHTNDAPGAITRLIDMGIEPFLIASSVILVAAQRLVRKICPHCKEGIDIPESVLQRVGFFEISNEAKGITFYKGKGCNHCLNTGYFGRMGILEVFGVDDTLREMIVKRASSDQLKVYAIKQGMKTLREDALMKFKMGLTSLDEVLRVTSEE